MSCEFFDFFLLIDLKSIFIQFLIYRVEPNGIDLRSILNLWILIRLNNNHIGTNKKFKLLFHSVPNSKIEGTFKVSFDDKSAKMNEAEVSENKSYRLDVTFEHKSNDKVLNHLDTAIKLNNFHNSEQFQLTTYIRHVDTDKIEWRVSYKKKCSCKLQSKNILFCFFFYFSKQ